MQPRPRGQDRVELRARRRWRCRDSRSARTAGRCGRAAWPRRHGNCAARRAAPASRAERPAEKRAGGAPRARREGEEIESDADRAASAWRAAPQLEREPGDEAHHGPGCRARAPRARPRLMARSSAPFSSLPISADLERARRDQRVPAHDAKADSGRRRRLEIDRRTVPPGRSGAWNLTTGTAVTAPPCAPGLTARHTRRRITTPGTMGLPGK